MSEDEVVWEGRLVKPVEAIWVYLIPAEGDCEAEGCLRDADGKLIALDDEGAGPISPSLCEVCLLLRLTGGNG